jgi:type VI secretion system protein ImpC
LQISLLHLAKPQLSEDLMASDDLTRSRLYRLLVDSTTVAGADPWTLVVGNYTFDAEQPDTELLGRIAQVHASAGAVFVAAAAPGIVGCQDLANSSDPHDWDAAAGSATGHWQALRSLPSATSVSLALPRVLARCPYGESSNPIDAFDFEEVPDGRQHRHYLWMNPAFAVATMLGRSFSAGGWSVSSAWSQDLDDLPIFFYSDGGNSMIKPCAEVELVLRAGGVLADAGLTTVYSIRDQGSIRIPSVRSLSSSSKDVAGAWE